MFPRNYYAVLRVPEDADPAAIRHAYRILARRFHPDAGTGSSAQKFREVTEAYDVLSDTQRRQDHDIDLARSRLAHSHVPPEPLIPESSVHVVFRRSAFGIDEEIARMFRIMEDLFGQIGKPR
jgi:curved DNA-binding protein CbpA